MTLRTHLLRIAARVLPLIAAVLAGCMDMVQPTDVAIAEELCAKRGGYANVLRWERGKVLDVNCKDGTLLNVRPPSKP